jgi:hypothetical protein
MLFLYRSRYKNSNNPYWMVQFCRWVFRYWPYLCGINYAVQETPTLYFNKRAMRAKIFCHDRNHYFWESSTPFTQINYFRLSVLWCLVLQVILPVLTLLMRHKLCISLWSSAVCSNYHLQISAIKSLFKNEKKSRWNFLTTLMTHNYDDALLRKHFSFRPIWVQKYVNHFLYPNRSK